MVLLKNFCNLNFLYIFLKKITNNKVYINKVISSIFNIRINFNSACVRAPLKKKPFIRQVICWELGCDEIAIHNFCKSRDCKNKILGKCIILLVSFSFSSGWVDRHSLPCLFVKFSLQNHDESCSSCQF
jgi:hypothetical protein